VLLLLNTLLCLHAHSVIRKHVTASTTLAEAKWIFTRVKGLY